MAIRPNDSSIVLIKTFYVVPGRAGELAQLLIEATDTVIRHQPGFISANLHISLHKKRVVHYARWRSKEDFEAMRSNPDARPQMEQAASIAEVFDSMIYFVAHVEDRASSK
jgi:heme-degrading monooxygenase HmoA